MSGQKDRMGVLRNDWDSFAYRPAVDWRHVLHRSHAHRSPQILDPAAAAAVDRGGGGVLVVVAIGLQVVVPIYREQAAIR